MGLLETAAQNYYQGVDTKSYQFTSLEDIINQFLVVYVGEEKIIGKVSRVDIAFHAQRALAELSFDTFKSIKSQEIVLPPTLTMMIPHDYVNYTKISWSDDLGVKHPLYPTKHTSNPFKVKQMEDGGYVFHSEEQQVLINGELTESIQLGWSLSNTPPEKWGRGIDKIFIDNERLAFKSYPDIGGNPITSLGRSYAVWQEIDVANISHISLRAVGERAAAAYQGTQSLGAISDDPIITFGLSTQPGTTGQTNPIHVVNPSINNENIYDLLTVDGDPSYVKWDGGDTAATPSEKSRDLVDVTQHSVVYAVITSNTMWNGGTTGFVNFTKNNGTVIGYGTYGDIDAGLPGGATAGNFTTNYIDSMELDALVIDPDLTLETSTTWANYKSGTPSENQSTYDDDNYWPLDRERYGSEPFHTQVNGSFFIDNPRNLINFSSNISGKTVILDYISDSLGTDGEMQVHKFAEEAVYKWILHAVLSTRIGIPEYIVNRYKKEKFAAIRQAKLRLSNIKLEEITQVLRGKSKWIKH